MAYFYSKPHRRSGMRPSEILDPAKNPAIDFVQWSVTDVIDAFSLFCLLRFDFLVLFLFICFAVYRVSVSVYRRRA